MAGIGKLLALRQKVGAIVSTGGLRFGLFSTQSPIVE